jgi:RNA polymerase sigma factor (sigma-70 family)
MRACIFRENAMFASYASSAAASAASAASACPAETAECPAPLVPHHALITATPRAAVETVLRDLFNAHHDRLYSFVLRHIGHAGDAEDLVQQAFVEAARTYARFRGESMLSTWLYGIALNLVRNHLSRAPQRRHRFDDVSVLEHVAVNVPNPEEQCAMTQLVVCMNEALSGLMPEMREVLLLVAHNDMSYEDCAAMLKLPIGTVRSRVSRARSHLRRRMGERGAVLPF